VALSDPGDGHLEALFRRHAWELERKLIARGFPPQVADESVNTAFMAMARKQDLGLQVADAPAFLFTVALHAAQRGVRTASRSGIPDSDRVSRQPATHDGGIRSLIISEDVRRALEQLPPRQREALTLRVIADLSVSDAARIMKVSPATVESNRRDAENKLRTILQRQGYGKEDVR
jgi:RNA polymerase sigma-70 factor (ECF subfamily)